MMMKYVKQIIGMMTVVLLLCGSCSDDFLDLAPISESNAENFYKTAEDFEAAVVGAYSNLQSEYQYGSDDTRFGGGFYALMEVRADDAIDGEVTSGVGRDVYDIDTYDDNPLSNLINGSWGSIYKTVFDVNAVLTRIDDVEFDEALKNQYRAEARFLRALCFFNAVRLWGDVPIPLTEITPQEAMSLSRTSVAEVYATIESDLKFSSENLPISAAGQEGRATSGAAKSLLGKVYLTQEKWMEAATILEEVIGSSSFTLLSDVEEVFAIDNQLNDEIIFSVRFKGNADDDVGHLGFGTPEYQNLVDAYDPADARLPLLDPISSNNENYPAKQYEDGGGNDLGRDWIVLRYADVLLMCAEALNEMGYQSSGNAFDYLNQIRTRAGLAAYSDVDLTSQSEFRDAVLEERRFELALEQHRWFDLLRTDRAIDVMEGIGASIKAHQLLYPIPQTEIDSYNNSTQFPQNPGY